MIQPCQKFLYSIGLLESHLLDSIYKYYYILFSNQLFLSLWIPFSYIFIYFLLFFFKFYLSLLYTPHGA